MPRKTKTRSVILSAPVVDNNLRPVIITRKMPKHNAKLQKSRKPAKGTKRRNVLQLFSPDGIEFLKTATAGPDFDIMSCQGVPDLYSGKSLVSRQYCVTPIEVLAGQTMIIIATPTPGVCAWSTSYSTSSGPTGSNVSFVSYRDRTLGEFFPAAVELKSSAEEDNCSVVTQFRYIGHQAELVPTTNSNTWAGTIEVFKAPLQLDHDIDQTSGSSSTYVSGCAALFADASASSFITTSNQGAYSVALDNANFEFSQIRDVQNSDSITYGVSKRSFMGVPIAGATVQFNGPVLGWGHSDTIVFRISNPLGSAVQTFMFRNWSVIEYTPTPGSMLEQFATASPSEDHLALVAYKNLAANLPTAVTYGENANFWDRVRRLVISGGKFLGHLPGPVGAIANAVSQLVEMI